MNLQDISIDLEYRSNRKDVVTDFYIPVLGQSIEYDRAVGFFSSTALIEISKGIGRLLENGGTINLIASPKLSEEDINAIEYGYREKSEVINNALLRSFSEPENIFQEKRLNLLAYLVSIGKMNIKIAYVNKHNNIGIFHEKLGIVKDDKHNVVAFSGSANESSMAFNYNYESIDVFCNWKSEESNLRCEKKVSAFSSIWANAEDGVEVIEFPQVVRERLQKYNVGPIEVNIDEEELTNIKKEHVPSIPEFVHLYDYQLEAIQAWKKNNYIGIYDMATGTGKTYTGLSSLVALYQEKKKLAVILLCPYLHLVEQWIEDLKLFHIPYIVGNSAYSGYRNQLSEKIFDYNLGLMDCLCFVCTNDTFVNKTVQELIEKIHGEVLIVADEAHNLGTKRMQEVLDERYVYRLALSATIDRFGDPEGTDFLYQYFQKKCIEYPLSRAIEEKKLTPYRYYPQIVTLTDEELEAYRDLSHEIGKCISVDKRGKRKLSEKGKRLAIKRARLVAGAVNKLDLLKELMEKRKNDKHILVYCGAARLYNNEEDEVGKRQIEAVTEILGENLGMRVARFTSEEDVQTRTWLKQDFESGDELQALIAIKCLDEGVNIPSIKTAFILASTSNPKEYVQRRGRVLRKFQGKEYAEIYDFITMPRPLDSVSDLPEEEKQKDMALLRRELNRVREFGKDAINFLEAEDVIELVEESYGCIVNTYGEGEDLDV